MARPLPAVDGPWSGDAGLDSTMSYDLIRVLKAITVKEKRTILCSIHQPSSQIFYTFDALILLMEGQVGPWPAEGDGDACRWASL